MASASASASTSYPQPDFDVFINHRGPDVKNTFAKHLYHRLRQHQIRVFLDKTELEVGHNIDSQIQRAIETARIHIGIFSSTYAESRWCLNELLDMVKAYKSKKATIIPVFYDVKPSDLRRTAKGAYAEAFHDHEKKRRFDTQTIQSWKEALSEVSTISGLELDAFNGDEDELLTKLLELILPLVSKMVHNKQLKYVAEHPTGLKEKSQEFENTVLSKQQSRSGAKVVGIAGIGGVGKTTIAKEIFNSIVKDFNKIDVQINSIRKDFTKPRSKVAKKTTRKPQ